MRLAGFRGYAEQSDIEIDDLTVLAGRNDAGKSTIFDALKLFLGQSKLDHLDHTVNGPGSIQITCVFSNLPPTLVIDSAAPTKLTDEHLLDADGNLQITKTWTGKKSTPDVSAYALHPCGEGLPLLIGLKQAELKKLADGLGVKDSLPDQRINLHYRRAIWEHWSTHGLSSESMATIPLNQEDGKQVALALESVFPVFHLFQADRVGSESESVAQDPAKLIVESVLERHTARLAELTTDVQTEVQEMLSDVVARLAEIAPELASGLAPIDIKPSWQKAFSALQFVDEHEVPLAKRGSGTRRLVLLSFFRAEVERDYEDTGEWRRGIIIAVEEPETALHPDLQRETLLALSDVAALPNRQVLLTTHSPNLIREIPIESVRFVETVDGSRVWFSQKTAPDQEILEHLTLTMGTFTDHNVRCFMIIEGRNDISGLLRLSDGLQEVSPAAFPDLRSLEKRGEICFVPIGGCGAAALWESRLSPFRRREVHLLDSDRGKKDAPLKESVGEYKRRFDSATHPLVELHILERREMENYLTVESIEDKFVREPGFASAFQAMIANHDWEYVDIPLTVARALQETRSSVKWADVPEEKKISKEGAVKRQLTDCFGHPSVAKSLVSDPSGSDLLRAIQALETP